MTLGSNRQHQFLGKGEGTWVCLCGPHKCNNYTPQYLCSQPRKARVVAYQGYRRPTVVESIIIGRINWFKRLAATNSTLRVNIAYPRQRMYRVDPSGEPGGQDRCQIGGGGLGQLFIDHFDAVWVVCCEFKIFNKAISFASCVNRKLSLVIVWWYLWSLTRRLKGWGTEFAQRVIWTNHLL